MINHKLFYYPYASFTRAPQLPLLRVAALYFDKLVILDPVGASWATIGSDSHACEAVKLLKDGGMRRKSGGCPSEIRRSSHQCHPGLAGQEFQNLCEVRGGGRWTLSLAKVLQDLKTDQATRHLMGDFAREVARDSAEYREQTGGNTHEYYEYAETGQAYLLML